MDVLDTPLAGVRLIRPRVFSDHRGRFLETWHRQRYAKAGIDIDFVQDNAATSHRHVLRGLHYQWPNPQGKLVGVLEGEVFDVAVDIRRGSPTFAQWYGTTLTGVGGEQLWIPEGFAHGYLVLSERAVLSYKCTRVYDPAGDRAIRWDDPEIGVEWGVGEPMLSEKDAGAPFLSGLEEGTLPTFQG